MPIRNSTVACAVLCWLATTTATSFPQDRHVTPEIVERLSKSVVLPKGTNDTGAMLGSGFLLSSDGKIAISQPRNGNAVFAHWIEA